MLASHARCRGFDSPILQQECLFVTFLSSFFGNFGGNVWVPIFFISMNTARLPPMTPRAAKPSCGRMLLIFNPVATTPTIAILCLQQVPVALSQVALPIRSLPDMALLLPVYPIVLYPLHKRGRCLLAGSVRAGAAMPCLASYRHWCVQITIVT